MDSIFKGARVAAVAATLVTQIASAATTPPTTILYGGGATFPSEAYIGSSFLLSAIATGKAARLSQTVGVPAPNTYNPADTTTVAPADKGSLFGAFAALNPTIGVSYCQTGSGTGKGVIVGGRNATTVCGDYGASSSNGFSAPTAQANFAGTDAPLTQTEINSFNSSVDRGAAYGQPVQLPYVAGSIAVIYNNTSLGKKKLNLTRSDICGIFSGRITNWDQLTNTPKLTIASKPIKLIYRSDSSGTTFSFTNFLTQVCPTLSLPGDVAFDKFQMTQTFNTAFLTGASLPAGAIGASGNGGVITAVNDGANDGAISYADVADAVARAKLGNASLSFATVSYAADQAKEALVIGPGESATCKTGGVVKDKATGQLVPVPNPIVNTSTTKPLKFSCPAIVYNKLDPTKNVVLKGATGVAVTASAATVLGSVNTTTGRISSIASTGLPTETAACVQTVDPAAYAEPATALTKKAARDYGVYPVIAVSYLMGYNKGNGDKTEALKSLFKAGLASSSTLAKTKTIGKSSGFQPLALTLEGFASGSALVDACITQ